MRTATIMTGAALLCAVVPASAGQGLQPGMRTMIQQGGLEGTVLGPNVAYPYGADPDHGYVYDDRRYGRVVFVDPNVVRRHRLRALDESPRHVRVRLRGD